MSMKVRYTTVNGEIIAEKRNGVRSLYVPDPLGSTVALLDNTQTITDTVSYFPYGEVAARTGTNPTPFLHVGTKGYRKDSSSNTSVRHRILKPAQARWLTEDPIGYMGGDWNLYRYVTDAPVHFSDPSGYSWCCNKLVQSCCKSEDPVKKCHGDWSKLVKKLGPIFGVGHGNDYLCDKACPEIKKWLTDLSQLCGTDLMVNVPTDFCNVILWFEYACQFDKKLAKKLEPYANGCASKAGRTMPPKSPPRDWGE